MSSRRWDLEKGIATIIMDAIKTERLEVFWLFSTLSWGKSTSSELLGCARGNVVSLSVLQGAQDFEIGGEHPYFYVFFYVSLLDLRDHYCYSNRRSGVRTEKGKSLVSQPSSFFSPLSLGFYKTLTPKHIKSLSCLQNPWLHRVCLSLVIIT